MVENKIQQRWMIVIVSNIVESQTFQRRVKIQRQGKGSTLKDGAYISSVFVSSQTNTTLLAPSLFVDVACTVFVCELSKTLLT